VRKKSTDDDLYQIENTKYISYEFYCPHLVQVGSCLCWKCPPAEQVFSSSIYLPVQRDAFWSFYESSVWFPRYFSLLFLDASLSLWIRCIFLWARAGSGLIFVRFPRNDVCLHRLPGEQSVMVAVPVFAVPCTFYIVCPYSADEGLLGWTKIALSSFWVPFHTEEYQDEVYKVSWMWEDQCFFCYPLHRWRSDST